MNVDDVRGRLALTVPEAGELLGLGRSAAYAAARRGEIPTIRLGRKLIVPVPKLLEMVGVPYYARAAIAGDQPDSPRRPSGSS